MRRDEMAKENLLGGDASDPETFRTLKKALPIGFNDSNNLLKFDAPGMLMTVAPTRSGKGTDVIVQALLTFGSGCSAKDMPSVVVTDPKGENYSITARRRREIGTEIAAFDPFGAVVAETACYNPLDGVRDIDDAAVLANAIVVDESTSGDKFWIQKATAMLKLCILYVALRAPDERRNLAEVRRLCYLTSDKMMMLLRSMAEEGGTIEEEAGGFLTLAEAQGTSPLPGILTELQRHLEFLASDKVKNSLCKTTFDLRNLKHGRAASVYLIIPPDKLAAGYSRVLRLFLLSVTMAMQQTAGQGRKVVCLLDEFCNLGRLGSVAQDYTLAGGYGLTHWAFIQGLDQLKEVYGGSANTFLANSSIIQFFAPTDKDTLDWISGMLGQKTETIEQESHSHDGKKSKSFAFTGRDLMTPDEVRRMPRNRMIVFVRGKSPIFAQRFGYYELPALLPMADKSNMR